MFDYLKFGVNDYAVSNAFFLKALEPLGGAVLAEGPALSHELLCSFVFDPHGHDIEVDCHEPEACPFIVS